MLCIFIILVVLFGFYMFNDFGEKFFMGIMMFFFMIVFLMIVVERLFFVFDNVFLIGIFNVYLLKLEIKDIIKILIYIENLEFLIFFDK